MNNKNRTIELNGIEIPSFFYGTAWKEERTKELTLKALEKGIKMEIDGKEFYLKSSQNTSNELGKKLLLSLAAEEDIHRKVFEEIYDNIRECNIIEYSLI